uniref:Activin_recp domain-containing protein n=1 Tax=Rhabditophanes sp. KR3021 TaxID=114890 RepID=A0AC35TVG3_9BILA
MKLSMQSAFSILAFGTVVSIAAGLNCFQSQGNSSFPAAQFGPSTACTSNPVSACLKTVDSLSKIATRSCSMINCTENGLTINPGKCIVSGTTESCCCYGDSCNEGSANAINKFLMAVVILAVPFYFTI